MRWIVFFGPFETHTESSVSTCQSGVPSIGKTASGLIAAISRFTPGVETPGRGGRAGSFLGASCPNALASMQTTLNTQYRALSVLGVLRAFSVSPRLRGEIGCFLIID